MVKKYLKLIEVGIQKIKPHKKINLFKINKSFLYKVIFLDIQMDLVSKKFIKTM